MIQNRFKNLLKFNQQGGEKMSQTDRGVLMLYEWYRAMESLSPKDYKTMMSAIWHFQLEGQEPPEFKGKSAIAAAMIFPYIRRRREAARAGILGAQARFPEYDSKARLHEMIEKHMRKKDT